MLPVPSREAVMALCGCAAMIAIGWGTGAAAAVIAGGTGALGLCVAFALTVPAAARLRMSRVELAWWIETARALPVAGGSFEARCSLRNHGERALRLTDLRALVPEGVEAVLAGHADEQLEIPGGCSAELELKLRAPAVGRIVLQGMVASVPGPFGLFSAPVRFPSPLTAKILPRAASQSSMRFARRASETIDRAARSALRVRGAGTELYEIREYHQGDPFNAIAWKPSARAGRLLVREVEREAQHSMAIVLDAGATMRGGSPGHRKLDLAIEAAARMAKEALARGDRVALRAVDGRVLAQVSPGEGPRQLPAIYEALLKLTEVVDEDLTDIEEQVLMRRVASYIRQQEGVDLWLEGELDVSALTAHVARALDGERRRVLPIASSRSLGRLRRYCQLRGIPLPYRVGGRPDAKLKGLSQALREEAGDTRSTRTLIVISDLDDIASHEPWLSTLKMLAARGHRVLILVPELGAHETQLAEARGDGLAADLFRVVARAEVERLSHARRVLGAVGVGLSTYRAQAQP